MSRLIAALVLGISAQAYGQWQVPPPDVPFQEELASVHITLETAGYDALFHPDSVWSNFEHPATFVYVAEGIADTLYNVGFRLRGNTSRTSAKKSFKVSFDTYDEDGQWRGLNKMNLNGEHNDVSMMRARLVHTFFNESGVASSRANHVRLYLNGTYRGLYTNVEHIDGEWLEKRLPHAHGNLWKCTYPANLLYNGPDGEDYMYAPPWTTTPVYELKTNEAENDYDGLAGLIDVLNNTPIADLPCALEDRFDVNRYLRTAAAEVLAGHWDNYIGNQNNFYLYRRTPDGRLTYLSYDLDNTLGVEWGGDWVVRDVYNYTTENRPLYTRLMQVPLYRELYTWHLRDLINTTFDSDAFETRGADWQVEAADAAAEDAYYPLDYGFDYDDFTASLLENYGQHVPYGIVPYVGGRSGSAQLQMDPPAPHPGWLMAWAKGPAVEGQLVVEAVVEGTVTNLTAAISWDGGSAQTWPLTDDDGDGLYTVTVDVVGSDHAEVQVTATFADGVERISPCAPQWVWTSPMPSGFRLNEVMALNNSFVLDEWGGAADWAEITLIGDEAANVNELFLTNRWMEPKRWRLPNVTLDPGDHLLVWCDDDTEEGPLHANFNLDADGETLYLMAMDEGAPRVVDAVTWPSLPPNVSWARVPDGQGPWTACSVGGAVPPTPDAVNEESNAVTEGQQPTDAVYPNPLPHGGVCTVEGALGGQVRDAAGRVVAEFEGTQWHRSGLPSGRYVVEWRDGGGRRHHADCVLQ